MKIKDFKIFTQLMEVVYEKAFNEKMEDFTHGKAQSLSWFIYQQTGKMLSYKSLSNYMRAIHHNTPETINPTTSTLSILIQYFQEDAGKTGACIPDQTRWYIFKKEKTNGENRYDSL